MTASFILRLLPLWFVTAITGRAPQLVPIPVRARRRS